jgi:hypothetical protein
MFHKKISSIHLLVYRNASTDSQVVQTDGHTVMTNLIVSFRNFAKVPGNKRESQEISGQTDAERKT